MNRSTTPVVHLNYNMNALDNKDMPMKPNGRTPSPLRALLADGRGVHFVVLVPVV